MRSFLSPDQPGLYAMGCNMDGLLISYNKNHHFAGGDQLTYLNTFRNTENTLLSFNAPFAFTYGNGVVVNPLWDHFLWRLGPQPGCRTTADRLHAYFRKGR